MTLPDFSVTEWLLAIAGAVGLGVGKAGLAGISLLHVLIFAFLFGARESTGVVLPMLLVGDVCAVYTFHHHARWDYVRRMLPPACIGIMAAAWWMRALDSASYKPIIGWIILVLAIVQAVRLQRPALFGDVPHSRWFAWSIGLVAGATTMLANAAGPIFSLYALAIALPKFEFVGTGAWLFFIINLFKLPFSYSLGLIRAPTLGVNLVLTPAILAGVLGGRWIVTHIPQRLFERLLLAFAALAALRLIL